MSDVNCNTEKWLPVVGYEGLYEVSDCGRVKTLRTNKLISCTLTRGGYIKVFLCRFGIKKCTTAHFLVLSAFTGCRPLGYQCNHINGNRADNRIENLEWCTASANVKHSFDVLGKKRMRGELCGTSKLTSAEVENIRQEHATGQLTQTAIGKKYGVTVGTISRIVNKLMWK